ncbi:Hypothetical protein P9211_08081 [Prochlorococcus marinus str. MIT 9211]|uniref:SAM-dependent methyltransferase n=1 Tax=Prochlorococcus marinus (strain MIT 9211) TaxID=93059 RepID=A9BA77_PROM4|nr:Hypothetical protein P9211_08081 [Prochlorococcus marinus str. MIT 9211]
MLEIASGSGEHAVFFQTIFNHITWQTSDPHKTNRNSILSWIISEGLTSRMKEPLDIDVNIVPWQVSNYLSSRIRAIVCINMIHVTEWSSTLSLFNEALNHLKKGDPLIIYGPFKRNGRYTSISNENFDKSLKIIDSNWGLRDLDLINKLAIDLGYNNLNIIDMPANNFLAVYRKNL